HVKKKDKIYRYYTCLSAIKRGYRTCPIGSIPSDTIETFVLEMMREYIISPDLIKTTLSSLKKRKNFNFDIDDQLVIQELKKLDLIWDELFPAMKARILNLLIKEINMQDGGINISFNISGMPLLYETLKMEINNA
ncbi:MAG: zinc ribbon domain-containing protein, partial [Alphaproteobacteria bacterium]